MNGARAKVKPIPERPIAYAVASLFRKYSAVTTEKDWYSSAKPIPKRSKEGYRYQAACLSRRKECGQTREKVHSQPVTSNRCPQAEGDLGFALWFQSHQGNSRFESH